MAKLHTLFVREINWLELFLNVKFEINPWASFSPLIHSSLRAHPPGRCFMGPEPDTVPGLDMVDETLEGNDARTMPADVGVHGEQE